MNQISLGILMMKDVKISMKIMITTGIDTIAMMIMRQV